MNKKIVAFVLIGILAGAVAGYAQDVDVKAVTSSDIAVTGTNTATASIRGTIKAVKIDFTGALADVDIDITDPFGETIYSADDVTADTVFYPMYTVDLVDAAAPAWNTTTNVALVGISCVGDITIVTTDGTTNDDSFVTSILYQKK